MNNISIIFNNLRNANDIIRERTGIYIIKIHDFSILNRKIASLTTQFSDTIGHYSTVGVAKVCCPITIGIKSEIDNNFMESTTANFLNSNIVYGIYESPEDSTEKVYSYKFELWDEKGDLLETSGV